MQINSKTKGKMFLKNPYLLSKTNYVYINLFFFQFSSKLVQLLFIKIERGANEYHNPGTMIFTLAMFKSKLWKISFN